MTDTTTAGLCRLTVRAPGRRFELAVPADVPLAELLPVLVEHARAGAAPGEARADAAGGWVLQRLGEDPLDTERGAADLGLRDGETVHLRPRADRLPRIHFDDLVDGIATGMRERPDAWRPAFTHHLLIGLSVAALAAAFGIAALTGPASARVPLCAAFAVLLLIGATLAARALGDGGSATALGLAAVPYAAALGALVPHGPAGDKLIGARLLAGGASGTGAAALALAGVAVCAPLFLAVAVITLSSVLGGTFMVLGDYSPSQAAGAVAVLVMVFGAFVPVLAFRLAGFRLPPLPTNADQLQEGIEPHPAADTLRRSAVADGYMTGLYAAAGALCAACLGVLVLAGHRTGLRDGIAGVLCLLLLLHARALGGAWQRLAMVLPAAFGLGLLAVTAHGPARGAALAGCMLAAAALAVAAWSLPGRRTLPYWGRAADVLHTLAAIGLIPLVLWNLGVYDALRGALS
ncbi:type VII secretion integral membrane protein EccD [Actinomadura rupiterrae]|uniref:type VII secretion integral membrane protein EccD n=1 Tax=Actinomadura rupiterrae TaxID=559627 RepID=UPI0020A30A32|nr:type VII secretion integral membrane protein EccD [Actinomadura rupiterrae]MCP2336731.1 type VII secretion integral membrane protein EccD [Actinomadura rupiterrae]